MSSARDGKRLDRSPMSINEWARAQRELLKLERDEETSQVADAIAQLTAQECMERGISLVPLAVTGLSTGLYGRACVSVGDPKGRPLPAHRLGSGDQVRLHSTKGSKGGKGDAEEGVSEILGVVGKVSELTVEVISNDADDAGSLRGPLRLDVVASEATHKKLMLGLDALEKYPGGGPAERVINVLFGLEPPSAAGAAAAAAATSPPRPAAGAAASAAGAGAVESTSPALQSLNDSQREAVAFGLSTRDVALIHGPPGTGKTTTVVALVREAVARGWRCLVCAPSNVAVDGILERLVAVEGTGGGNGGGGNEGGRKSGGGRPRVVRMGHPARLLPQVLEHSLEALVSRHEGTAIVKDVRKEIDSIVSRLYGKPGAESGGGKASRSRVRGADRKGAKQEVKTLRKEARAREGKVVREVLRSRDVVLATCVGAATYSLREEEFDLVVIDEAAQALEAACWIPILKGRRLVLAGDHKQLAPTVKSRKAEAGLPTPSSTATADTASPPPHSSNAGGGAAAVATDGLGLTMFDRVLRDLGEGVCRMLDVQYRMNRDICDWASTEMYGGLLRAHPSVADRQLSDLPHAAAAAVQEMDMWAAVMLLIDTTGCDMPEEEAGGGSRRNEREAEVAVRHVKGLLEAGIAESEVAIISPYNGQVNLLKRLLRQEHPGVEVRSVDGFQGGEKEAIVLSLVRSNPAKKVGFLADARRLNVAVTRAKRHVAVVCDAERCGSDAFIGRLLRHIEERGEYRSALELQPDDYDDFREAEATAAIATAAAPTRSGGGGGGGRGGGGGGGGKGGRAEAHHRDQEVLSDEDVLRRVEEFAGRGSTSKGGRREELELPSELTARQRALVHETAEWLGLDHVSKGDGQHRTLVLSKSGDESGGPEPTGTVVDECDEDSSSSSSSERSDAKGVGGAVGGSPFSALMGEDSEDDADNDSDADGGPGSGRSMAVSNAAAPPAGKDAGAAAAAAAAVEPSVSDGAAKPAACGAAEAAPSPSRAPPAGAPNASKSGGTNSFLAALHAERVARRPPVPPSPPPPPQGSKSRKKGGGGKGNAATAAAVVGDDRGFTIDIPSGGPKKKSSSSKKGGSGSKKGKGKSGGGGGDGGKGKPKGSSSAKGAGAEDKGDGGEEDDDDDELAFLDAQIRKERRAEPCYASLLRSTTEAMRQNNPRWAAAEDKGKPAKSYITGARRSQLKGALQTRLTEEEKKRVRQEKGEKKT